MRTFLDNKGKKNEIIMRFISPKAKKLHGVK